MIKVLMIGNHPSNKGGMTSVINQIREYDWLRENVELFFIPTFFPGNILKKIAFFTCSYFRILLFMLFSHPDIVHMHMSYKGSFTRKYLIHRLCSAFRVKDIIHLHGSEFEKWYIASNEKKQRKIRRLLSECNRLIVLGNEWKEIVKRIEPSAKVQVISNGITIPAETACWNDSKCQLLFLGVLIPRKGVSDLVEAISLLKKDKLLGNCHLVIAGTGEEEEKLKQQVKKAELTNEVSFVGWVSGSKKNKLLLDSQVLISPSYNEGLPISILEAASYGLPIISTNVGDIASVVKDKRNGLLIQPGDIEALSKGIMKIASRETFTKMSAESRKIAVESFSIDSFYEKLSNLYHKIGETNGR